MDAYGKGTKVIWNWGDGQAEGTITEIFNSRVTKEIKGASVTRNADDKCPAYLVEQEDGAQVLKSHSELLKAGRV